MIVALGKVEGIDGDRISSGKLKDYICTQTVDGGGNSQRTRINGEAADQSEFTEREFKSSAAERRVEIDGIGCWGIPNGFPEGDVGSGGNVKFIVYSGDSNGRAGEGENGEEEERAVGHDSTGRLGGYFRGKVVYQLT